MNAANGTSNLHVIFMLPSSNADAPEDIQDAIRAKCGDTCLPERPLVPLLPATCTLNFPGARWAQAARTLRAERRLVNELRWHRAAVATFIDTMDVFEVQAKNVLKQIDEAKS